MLISLIPRLSLRLQVACVALRAIAGAFLRAYSRWAPLQLWTAWPVQPQPSHVKSCCAGQEAIAHFVLNQALSTIQSVETFLCTVNKFIDLRLDLICKISFISVHCALVD